MKTNEIERRSTTGEVKTEARTLVGYCARYDSPTVIGSGDTAFTEVILKGAFRSCIERGDDIAFLREHQPTMLLARHLKRSKSQRILLVCDSSRRCQRRNWQKKPCS